jgi:pyruvate dehydrogenase E1 component alpha subunit/2-oxoisovalerate dehydrogenase E1 component
MIAMEPRNRPNKTFELDCLALDLGLSNRFYFQMKLIRTVEEMLLDLFTKGELSGTTHTCLGQEANAVGILNALDRNLDLVFSNHRSHGHFIAYSGHVEGLLAEILGRVTGVCGGRGGSQHLHWHNFYSTGIQGGLVPIAVGAANVERKSGAIAVVFLGDGTMGQGTVYEGLNLAALLSAPVLFVVEDNGIAQTTPKAAAVSGSIAERAAPFGIRCFSKKSTDVEEIHELASSVAEYVRSESKPAWLHLETIRLGPLSKGDDTREKCELDELATRDPLLIQRPRADRNDQLDRRCVAIVGRCIENAKAAPTACE